MNDTAAPKDKSALCFALYGIFAVALFLQFSMILAAVSTVLVILAVIIAYLQRGYAAGTIYESHFHWMIRTFWIGGSVYLPILTVAAAGVLYYVALPTLQAAIDTGETDVAALQNILMEKNGKELITAATILFLPFAVWWLYRCGKGIKLLLKKLPVEDVNSWI